MFLIVMVILALVAFSLCGEDNIKKQYEEARDPVFKKLGIKNDIIYSNNVEYLGGSPDITQDCTCYIDQLDNNNLVVYTWKFAKRMEYTLLEKENIKSIQLVDKTQIINNPNLASVLVFGTAGLAIGNKDVDENYYLNIEYKNINIIFSCKSRYYKSANLREKAIQIYSNLNRSVLNS